MREAGFSDFMVSMLQDMYDKVLGRVRQAAVEQGFAASVGYSGTRELKPDKACRDSIQVQVVDATWADDSAGLTWHTDLAAAGQCCQHDVSLPG